MNEEEKYIEPESNEELYQKFVYKTDSGQEPYRIDKFLMNRIEGATRNKIQQAIHNKMVLVNGSEVKPNFKVKANQEIVVYTDTAPDENEILPENIPLNIFYEDEHIIIVNKAAGMVVHPGSGNYDGTLLNGIAWHLQQNTAVDIEALPRFGLVHRIDKNTSGLFGTGKTEGYAISCQTIFDHTEDRKYIALVWEMWNR